ncbi:MAG: PAS domain-containing protein [Alphaproteobacteria bacterium]
MTQAITAGLSLDLSIPLTSLPRMDGTERRTCALALLWWQDLAGDPRAPTRQDIATAPAPDFWKHLFLLRCSAHDAESNRFEWAAPVACQALGLDPKGRSLAQAWPADALERAAFVQRSVADLLVPIEETGRWRSPDGGDIVFRCLLLPVADGEAPASHLLGVMSFHRQRALGA